MADYHYPTRKPESFPVNFCHFVCSSLKNEKSAEIRKHSALTVVRRSQKISPRRKPPGGAGRPKFNHLTGIGHYLYLQTEFGEDRVIVVTDHLHTNTPTPHTHTHRQDRLQYILPQLARSVTIKKLSSLKKARCICAISDGEADPRIRPSRVCCRSYVVVKRQTVWA